jgi:hypothetical protein
MTYARFALSAALVLALAPLACSKPSEPQPEPTSAGQSRATSPGPSAAAASPRPSTPAGPTEIAYDVPATWQKAENPSPMRKETYKIPRAPGDAEDAELSISQAGGSVDMNVKRWVGQFETKGPDATKQTERKVGDLKVTMVEIKGVFNGSGMPGGPPAAPKPNFALLGAIIETSGSPWFFKLTGPEKTVEAAKADFERFVGSIRPK